MKSSWNGNFHISYEMRHPNAELTCWLQKHPKVRVPIFHFCQNPLGCGKPGLKTCWEQRWTQDQATEKGKTTESISLGDISLYITCCDPQSPLCYLPVRHPISMRSCRWRCALQPPPTQWHFTLSKMAVASQTITLFFSSLSQKTFSLSFLFSVRAGSQTAYAQYKIFLAVPPF